MYIDRQVFSFYLFIVLSCLYLLIIVYKANWIFGDDRMLLNSTLIGENRSFYIYPQAGRFSPLALMEFNVLKFFGNSPYLYYGWVAIKAVVTIASIYFSMILITDSKLISYLFTVFFLVIPNVYFAFSHIYVPEATQIPLLSLFLLNYLLALRNKTIIYYGLSFICALLATYIKEPTFIILIVFAASMLLFKREKTKPEKLFYYALVLNAIVFLGLYYFLVYIKTSSAYHREFVMNPVLAFLYYTTRNPIFLLAILIGLYRLYKNISRKDFLISDAILYTGLSYVFAYIIMGLTGIYYVAPAYVFITIGFCGYASIYFSDLLRKVITFTYIAAFIFSLYFMFYTVSANISQRDNDIRDIIKISHLIGSKAFFIQSEAYDAPHNKVVDEYYSETFLTFKSYLGFNYSLEKFYIEHVQDLNQSDLLIVYKEFPKCNLLSDSFNKFNLLYSGRSFSLLEYAGENVRQNGSPFQLTFDDRMRLFHRNIAKSLGILIIRHNNCLEAFEEAWRAKRSR
jgi:hypothetical protein